jgi:hypothetical protein
MGTAKRPRERVRAGPNDLERDVPDYRPVKFPFRFSM